MKRRTICKVCAALFWGGMFWSPAILLLAQPAGKKAVQKVKATTDFELTTDTSNVHWMGAPWISLPAREGTTNDRLTKAKLLYSTKGIYGLFFCEDQKITATLQQDFADLYNEDVVEIFFWPDENFPIYFEYELSPLNYELAILVPNFEGKFLGWRPWHYENERLTRHQVNIVRQGEKVSGWMASFFIPYTLLDPLQGVPPRKGTRWRANLYRIDYDQGSADWSWQPTKVNFHDYRLFGTLVFD